MPNWKKLITSGSDASLASLVVANAVSASAFSGSFFGDGSGLTGSPTFTGLTVDTDTLYVDAANNRVGIGTTSPAYQVEIENTGANALLVLDRTDGAACFIEGQATRSAFGSVGATPLALAYNSLAVVTIGANGAITVNPDGDGFTFPTTDGTNGQTLITNGNGVLSFGSLNAAGIFAPTGSSYNTTNNLEITGSVTATSFVGDGSGLSNVVANVSETATITDTFTNTTSKTVTHSFGTKNVLVSTYNSSDQQIIPASVTTTDNDNVVVTFDTNTSGRVVVAKGGHIVSGSASDSTNLDGQPGSYYLNYDNFTNVPSGIVSGSAQIDSLTRYEESITGNTSYTITHSLGEDYPIVQVYDSNKDQVIPSNIRATNENTVTLTFDTNFTGRVVVKK